ncbi:MAG: heme exporter protein CcmB [Burkholderiaceae bacterium]
MNPSAASAPVSPDSPALPGAGFALRWSLRRDLRLALRSRAELAVVLVFFLLVCSLFPLAVSPEPRLLVQIAAGIAWIAALLSGLLALPHLFAGDHQDGSLEQILLSAAPLPALVTGKVAAYWLSTSLPVILLSPLMALQFGLGGEQILVLMASLLLGTPVLAWFGAIAAALTLGARGGASLLALLILPLAVPVLVFGAGAVEASRTGLGAEAYLSLLGAGLILACLGGPFATALAVRIAYE